MKQEKIYVNGVTLAAAAGVKPAFITQSRNKGYFAGATRKKRNSYLVEYHKEKCLAILADLDPAKKRKGEGNGLYTEERGKLIRAQRRRLEYNEKIKKGLYLPRDEIERLLFTIGRQLRNDLLNIPARTAAVIGGKSKKKEAEIYQLMRKEIETCLKDCLVALKKVVESEETNL